MRSIMRGLVPAVVICGGVVGIVFGIAYISRARELEILRDRMGRIQRSRDSVVDRQISRTASLGEAWLR